MRRRRRRKKCQPAYVTFVRIRVTLPVIVIRLEKAEEAMVEEEKVEEVVVVEVLDAAAAVAPTEAGRNATSATNLGTLLANARRMMTGVTGAMVN